MENKCHYAVGVKDVKQELNEALTNSGGDAKKLAWSYKEISLQIEDLKQAGSLDPGAADNLSIFVRNLRAVLPSVD